MSRFWLVLGLFGATASAGDVSFTWQARVTDALGEPFQGEQSITLSLYDDLEDVTPAWSRTYSPVVLNDGYASLQVTGESSAGVDLDELDFSQPVYLGVAVGQVTLGERQPLGMVPRAASSASGPAGTSAGAPATSCLSLRDAGDSSGFRWIDPDGSGEAVQVYCDQDTNDGGWTMCAGFDPYFADTTERRHRPDVFVTRFGSPLYADGLDDGSWGADCASLRHRLAATRALFTSDVGDWWSMDVPDSLANFHHQSVYNWRSSNDTTTNVQTNTGLTNVNVDWDGNCTWGTCAHEWHILEGAGQSCGTRLGSNAGGINSHFTPACQDGQYNSSASCGASASGVSCDNQWVRFGLR